MPSLEHFSRSEEAPTIVRFSRILLTGVGIDDFTLVKRRLGEVPTGSVCE